MDFQGTVWVKIDKQEDTGEVVRFISELDEQFMGDILVKVVGWDTHITTSLYKQQHVDVSAVPLLKEKYGADNVRFTGCTAYPSDEQDHIEVMLINSGRIADALESIASHLENMAGIAGDSKPNKGD